jgi:hypothetical protein
MQNRYSSDMDANCDCPQHEKFALRKLVAGVLINGVDEALLVYEFRNEPAADATDTMEAHHGHATLRLERGAAQDILVGEYYSGRGRLNIGTMRVTRDR